jgi:CRISPR-associated protein Csm1
VDGLGAVFSGIELDSFAKYSALSRSLDYFFKGYLNEIWRNNLDFKENTQIIYSGGDDLFIIGRWDYLIEFAEKIQEEFERWICFNSELGISGGIAVVTPKFPISKAADMSKEYESRAKKHLYPKDEDTKVNKNDKWKKNSINIFGKSLHWQNEYPTVKRLKDKFFELGDDVKATSMKIQGFHAEKESILEDLERIKKQEPSIRKDHTASWRWQLAYDIARTKERYKNKKELKEFLDEIKIDIFTKKDNQIKERKTEYEFFDLLALAARWAELEKRTKK